jgi:hypothetical protein
MKRYLLTASLMVAITSMGWSQIPEDALRVSWIHSSGTARQQAIGGAMASLGGEITATFVNPAGLGMYKTSEFVFSPGLGLVNSKGNFRGTDNSADSKAGFNLGTSGFVFGGKSQNSKWTSTAVSFAVNRTASFNNSTSYKGLNDYSSFAEPLANEFANSNLTIGQALNSTSISMLTKMALYTYLVDTATIGGRKQVIARSEQAAVVNQSNTVTSKGGVTEYAIGMATNMDDKIYFGATVGIPVLNYERTTHYKEEDANGRGNNEFASSTYNETYTSKGTGINLKVGMIFKPAERLRVGLAIHTPTLYGMKDFISADMTTDIDTATGRVKVFSVKSTDLYNGANPELKYDLSSPWRFMVSSSYVLHEIEDVTKQKGFITADVEYVGYSNPRFRSADVNITPESIYKELNSTVKDIYKGAFNVKVGGELKFNTIMGRLGFAYYGSPYVDKELQASRMNISGGIGYRNQGYFIDLTYVHSMQKDVNFPYRVDYPRYNTFAVLRETRSNVMLTLGVKF